MLVSQWFHHVGHSKLLFLFYTNLIMKQIHVEKFTVFLHHFNATKNLAWQESEGFWTMWECF